MHGVEREWVDGALVQSLIMVRTITLERLIRRGYESMTSYYEKVSGRIYIKIYFRQYYSSTRLYCSIIILSTPVASTFSRPCCTNVSP